MDFVILMALDVSACLTALLFNLNTAEGQRRNELLLINNLYGVAGSILCTSAMLLEFVTLKTNLSA